jgi:hypothetical protein
MLDAGQETADSQDLVQRESRVDRSPSYLAEISEEPLQAKHS